MLIDSLELVSFFGSTFEKLILGSTDICCWTREGSLFPLSALVEQKESRKSSNKNVSTTAKDQHPFNFCSVYFQHPTNQQLAKADFEFSPHFYEDIFFYAMCSYRQVQ